MAKQVVGREQAQADGLILSPKYHQIIFALVLVKNSVSRNFFLDLVVIFILWLQFI